MLLERSGLENSMRRDSKIMKKLPKSVEKAARQEGDEVGRQAGEKSSHEVHQHGNDQDTFATSGVRQRTPNVRAENHPYNYEENSIN